MKSNEQRLKFCLVKKTVDFVELLKAKKYFGEFVRFYKIFWKNCKVLRIISSNSNRFHSTE